MDAAEIYIEKYKQLESIVRSTYGISEGESILTGLKKRNRLKNDMVDLEFCQKVRNFLQHDKKINDRFVISPNEDMIDFIDHLIKKVKNRTKCSDIAIKQKDVVVKTYNDRVKNTIKLMRDNLFTHIPIVEDDRVVGVFDENSLFEYIAEENIIYIEEELRFKDIENYLSLKNREMEDFLFYKYQGYLDDLQLLFEKAFRNGRRIGMVFLTNNGLEKESLQGIITPWDMISA